MIEELKIKCFTRDTKFESARIYNFHASLIQNLKNAYTIKQADASVQSLLFSAWTLCWPGHHGFEFSSFSQMGELPSCTMASDYL